MAFALMAALLGLAAACYAPGLNGPFIVDDYTTLPRLARFGGIDSLSKLSVFLAGDITGTRPLSLLTFALNSTSWPAAPWSFKAANLLLHLLNGGVLFLFCRQLLRRHGTPEPRVAWIAAFSAGFWLLNPFNVSTVLYVIQRMAMLSALFVLAGLVTYLHGRSMLATRPRAGHYWMSAAILLGTGLAVLCKENGALLPLLALVLEYTLPRAGRTAVRPSRVWLYAFLWLPSLAVIALLVQHAGPAAYASRNFDLVERLLTESRVIIDYLWHWFNPFAAPRGVLADDYPVVHSLSAPRTTLAAVAGVSGLLVWAVWQRHNHPLLALAILFYFVGHLMESTIVPLEIYFEHRNYLPAMLLPLPVAVWTASRVADSRLALSIGLAVLVGLAVQTHRLAGIWGSDLALAKWSLLSSPGSLRAVSNMASTLSEHGRADLAIETLEQGLTRNPEQSHLQLQLLAEKCRAGGITVTDWEDAGRYFSKYPIKFRSFPLLASLVATADSPQCPGLDGRRLLTFVRQLSGHPLTRADPRLLRLLRYAEGELLLRHGAAGEALAAFSASVALRAPIGVGLQEVALLATYGHLREALALLDRVQAMPEPDGFKQAAVHRFYAAEIPHLRATLLGDLATQQGVTPP
ncbi:hypothetical protein EZJ19_09135 [Parasulfuritortus cantonensis]|uniref:Tetratricopeptide repeat protein n=1 Tax=Parasulfuritortus cantonensis TaxID=2528202 RepID=A0A4R1BCG1_9PROT|nr:hypothetical protein [Parasulfuritortus cantonensis]TCJ14735.1 hypothetical protein EZJ19_09135 [Parasulfuritortus cantonensis]